MKLDWLENAMIGIVSKSLKLGTRTLLFGLLITKIDSFKSLKDQYVFFGNI